MGKNGWAAFVSNGAVLIQYNGTKVLIDGLYQDFHMLYFLFKM